MLTIKAEIKRSELKVDGTYNVKIRFTLDQNHYSLDSIQNHTKVKIESRQK
jgi:hypothetical protein